MRPETKKYLWDALNAAEAVASFVEGRSFDDYGEDRMLRSAVERQFEIIGEALAQVRRQDPETANRIGQLPRVVAFRDILIHGYADIDNQIVWDVAVTHLKPLETMLRQLLAED